MITWDGALTCTNKFAIKGEVMPNQRPSDLAHVAKVSKHTWQLEEELQKPVIRKSVKRKVYSSVKETYLRY